MKRIAMGKKPLISEFDRLRSHLGHDIKVAVYGDDLNVAVECTPEIRVGETLPVDSLIPFANHPFDCTKANALTIWLEVSGS